METMLKIVNRLCFHPFTTTSGHVETCSWCFAWRSTYTRTIPGQGYDNVPGEWRRD